MLILIWKGMWQQLLQDDGKRFQNNIRKYFKK